MARSQVGTPAIGAQEIVLALAGALDMASCPGIREEIDTLLDRHRGRHLVLDLSRVTFLDSSGVGLLLGRFRRLQGRGLTLRLVGVRPALDRVLRLSGLHGIMTIETARHPAQRGGT